MGSTVDDDGVMIDNAEAPEVLRRVDTDRGEVVLRRRMVDGAVVHELITNGTFAMDSRETHTEELLAAHADLRPGARVLVGGLGLGYTARALLETSPARLVVVEIEACLVDWARAGVTPTLAAVAADPRVELRVNDVHRVLAGPSPDRGSDGGGPGWDAIVLDVDNGPDFLIHEDNERIYAIGALRRAVTMLAPGGTLVLWSHAPHPGLHSRLDQLAGSRDHVAEHLHRVQREGREFTYAVYTFTRSEGDDSVPGRMKPPQ